jgi:hypothetical protein
MAIRGVAVAPAARRPIVPAPATRPLITQAAPIAPIILGRSWSARRSTYCDYKCDRKRTRPKLARFS